MRPPLYTPPPRAFAGALRSALAELLDSAGADPRDPQAIGARLGLNKNLAWKLSKLVQSDDPSVVFQQMPGAGGVKIFFGALERAGAAEPALRKAQEAISAYDRLIKTHSGDRATLEMMGSELSPSGRRQRDEHHRKLLFQGASYVWGVQARVVLKVALVGPGAKEGLLDFASLNGVIDFRRIRQDVTWVMAARHANNDDGTQMTLPVREAIDPRYNAADQPPFMADFCSEPLPELRRVVDPTGTSFELMEGPVGKVGELTGVFGTMLRGIPYYRTPMNEWGEHSASCDIPAEQLVLDVFFHEKFRFAIPPEAVLYSEMGGAARLVGEARERYRLPLHEKLEDLGRSALPPATPGVPRYGAMVRAMLDRTGWDLSAFHGFRMNIAYPACPTALVLRYPLPAAP